MYFSWAERLWYVVDVGETLKGKEPIALLEDCNTERLSWTKVSHFEHVMKEVKLKNA